METFKQQAAQGDMLIRVINELPENVKEIEPEGGNFILAHSETGHNHVVRKQEGVAFYANKNDPFIAYLVINEKKVKAPCQIEHLRLHDKHETIGLFVGDDVKSKDKSKKVYEIRRQREYTPEGFRKAQD